MLAVPDHEQLWEATARSLQGLALTHLGDWETAEPLMREAADDLLKLLGENHHRTQAANERLAQAMALTAK